MLKEVCYSEPSIVAPPPPIFSMVASLIQKGTWRDPHVKGTVFI